MRYLAGLSLHPIRDMLALEPNNPRSLAFQVDRIVDHLAKLPALRDDGMPEPPERIGRGIAAILASTTAQTIDSMALEHMERRLLALSDAIARRFFLQGKEAERATGMTRLA